MKVNRIIVIVLDSVGIGELPDADQYGDQGSNTLVNTARAVGGLRLPNLEALGLGNLAEIEGVAPVKECQGAYGKMAETSKGKDTTTGHWELAGVILNEPFPVYPNGFPPSIIDKFSAAIGRGVLGNKPASGTEVIKELGELHIRTGKPIVYTSADSVFQIAAHEDVIPLNELYDMCRTAREITNEHRIGRVIARPFIGTPGNFRRTANRKDFSLPPVEPTILDMLVESGFSVYAVGKIEDIFGGRGISHSSHTASNRETIAATANYIKDKDDPGLIFANCVDFDMLWGHRNDPQAYAQGLEEFDRYLPDILDRMKPSDLLFILADHGCDPTTPSTDHSREYVPLIVYGERVKRGTDLGVRRTFADIAATIADIFGVGPWKVGRSFAAEIL